MLNFIERILYAVDFKYYFTGFIALWLFIYLRETGAEDLATRLFDALLLILGIVFGFKWKSDDSKKTTQNIDMEEMRTE